MSFHISSYMTSALSSAITPQGFRRVVKSRHIFKSQPFFLLVLGLQAVRFYIRFGFTSGSILHPARFYIRFGFSFGSDIHPVRFYIRFSFTCGSVFKIISSFSSVA